MVSIASQYNLSLVAEKGYFKTVCRYNGKKQLHVWLIKYLKKYENLTVFVPRLHFTKTFFMTI